MFTRKSGAWQSQTQHQHAYPTKIQTKIHLIPLCIKRTLALTGVSSPIVVPAAEQRRLCPSRNGLRDGDMRAEPRLSAIVQIDCLRRRPNVVVGRAPIANLPALVWPGRTRIDENTDGI